MDQVCSCLFLRLVHRAGWSHAWPSQIIVSEFIRLAVCRCPIKYRRDSSFAFNVHTVRCCVDAHGLSMFRFPLAAQAHFPFAFEILTVQALVLVPSCAFLRCTGTTAVVSKLFATAWLHTAHKKKQPRVQTICK